MAGSTHTSASIEKAFQDARLMLHQAGFSTPDMDASLLLEHACGATTLSRLLSPNEQMGGEQARQFANFICRRMANEPVHRIIGKREFYGLMFELNQATLVPRPDTEVLIDMVLPFVHEMVEANGTCRILDLGTGTGAIALSLLKEAPAATAIATDLADDALKMTRKNAKRHGLADRLTCVKSNWFSSINERFDLIISNPPYIETKTIERLDKDVKDHDPALALDGGADGLVAYRAIADDAREYLTPNGRIAVEIGYDQVETVQNIFHARNFMTIQTQKDLGGQNRAVFLQ